MTYRVVHCGTGNVGRFALRAIIEHPDLELVGHFVSSPDKVGRDSGELVRVAPVGITATDDWDELVGLGADCLVYFGDSIGREKEAIDDLLPFLRSGTNVVTFSGFAIAHPATAPPEVRGPVEDACREGGTSCYFTGIDPGWATTDLAIAALAAANRVDCVRVAELGSFGEYSAEFVMREYFGFGQEPGFSPLLVTGGMVEQMWSPTLHQLAAVIGVEIEEFDLVYETACLDHDIETGFGTVAAGTAAVVRFEFRGLVDGRPRVIVEHVDAVTREDLGGDWRRPYGPYDLAYRIEIEGDPKFSLELGLETNGSTLSAMPVINAVPAVCAAAPGLLGPLDVPRYGPPSAAARR
jgi:hypothetical protein